MSLRERLAMAAMVVAEEAERNGTFRRRLEEALGFSGPSAPSRLEEWAAKARGEAPPPGVPSDHRKAARHSPSLVDHRKGGRRAPSLVDPIDLARQSEGMLRERLAALDVEQLKDVVAQHGMDPGKLVMKWRDATRIIDRIVDLSMARSTKGDAFKGTKPPAELQDASDRTEPETEEPKS